MSPSKHRSRLCSLALTCVVGLSASAAHAGGPLILCRDGQPFLWPNGGASVPFNPDQGPLGKMSNEEATNLVRGAFDAWQNIDTSTIHYENAGPLPVDVDVTNFAPYFEPTEEDGLSPIVYDGTGEIFDLLFGPDSGILGFAQPEFGDLDACTISEGKVFLNGPTLGTPKLTLAVMVHEFGHYSNFAHAQVNGAFFFGDTNGPTPVDSFPVETAIERVESMYPFIGEEDGIETPDADDRAIASRMYPTADYSATTGTIRGRVRSSDGTPLDGVNVIARNVASPYVDAVSAISGNLSAGESTGAYTLTGLTPGAEYAVYVDEILLGGFSTTPLKPLPGPEEFYNGTREGAVYDDVLDIERLVPTAGGVLDDIDIVFNQPTVPTVR